MDTWLVTCHVDKQPAMRWRALFLPLAPLPPPRLVRIAKMSFPPDFCRSKFRALLATIASFSKWVCLFLRVSFFGVGLEENQKETTCLEAFPILRQTQMVHPLLVHMYFKKHPIVFQPTLPVLPLPAPSGNSVARLVLHCSRQCMWAH